MTKKKKHSDNAQHHPNQSAASGNQSPEAVFEPQLKAHAMPMIDPNDVLEKGPYIDGFSMRTVLGALFVSIVMMPGAVYLGLVAGQALGSAAEWVTIILFAEMARRSFAHLKRQEIFILFYVASSVAAVALPQVALAGGPFAGLIWNQYLLQSPQTIGISPDIPDWVVPGIDTTGIQMRNLGDGAFWLSPTMGLLSPIGLIAIGYVLGRLGWFGLGYVLFRVTSDVERLPFPLAPIAAEGSTALAEATDRDQQDGPKKKRSWRWTIFSIGASLGIIFGILYILLPVVSGLFLTKPIMLFPIPFVDFTQNVEGLMPASLVSISFDAGALLAGMVLPFPLVLGTFISVVLTGVIGNTILQRFDFFPHWEPGNALLINQMILGFDFWMSIGIGLAGAVALIGIYSMIKTFMRQRKKSTPKKKDIPSIVRSEDFYAKSLIEEEKRKSDPNEPPYRRACPQRGDFPVWLGVSLFVIATAGFILICNQLVPGFPIWWFLFFGFIWSPVQSYISARLIGLTGAGIAVPFLKETVFITSGYKNVDIWFVPIPLFDFGACAAKFREMELTRTKFTSLIKAELVMFPIIFIMSFLFWWFFWKMNQIPSDQFPFASRTWPVAARQAYLIYTANQSESPLLLQALKPQYILSACGAGIGLYMIFAFFGLPIMFFYGMLGGMGAPLHAGLMTFAGALLGRYYFRKKFGAEQWSRFVPVLAAGFACGTGLAGMIAVALALISQCTKMLPF